MFKQQDQARQHWLLPCARLLVSAADPQHTIKVPLLLGKGP